MKRLLAYLAEVGEDFASAYKYYEAFSPGRGGLRFERVFDQALAQVREGFVTHRKVFEDYHRVLLKNYPYILYYRLHQERAIVVGLLYAHADPAGIEATLRRRSP